jgi:hypothetical protein
MDIHFILGEDESGSGLDGATPINCEGFNPVWGTGLFHDVFEHAHENLPPFDTPETRLTYGGEIAAMGSRFYFCENFTDVCYTLGYFRNGSTGEQHVTNIVSGMMQESCAYDENVWTDSNGVKHVEEGTDADYGRGLPEYPKLPLYQNMWHRTKAIYARENLEVYGYMQRVAVRAYNTCKIELKNKVEIRTLETFSPTKVANLLMWGWLNAQRITPPTYKNTEKLWEFIEDIARLNEVRPKEFSLVFSKVTVSLKSHGRKMRYGWAFEAADPIAINLPRDKKYRLKKALQILGDVGYDVPNDTENDYFNKELRLYLARIRQQKYGY